MNTKVSSNSLARMIWQPEKWSWLNFPGCRKKLFWVAGVFLLVLVVAATLIPRFIIPVFFFEAGVCLIWLIRMFLKQARVIERLVEEDVIGVAQVLKRRKIGEDIITRLRFWPVVSGDPQKLMKPVEAELEGEFIHFDGLVIQPRVGEVMKGRRRALKAWMRIYGDRTPPCDGVEINDEYAKTFRSFLGWCRKLHFTRARLLKIISRFNCSPRWKEKHLVREAYGSGVFIRCLPGQVYVFRMDRKGNITPDLYGEGSGKNDYPPEIPGEVPFYSEVRGDANLEEVLLKSSSQSSRFRIRR